MPDISMCASEDCPLAVNCYRSEKSGTKPSEFWQAYADFKWHDDIEGLPRCDSFWRNPYKAAAEGDANEPR